MPAASRTLAGLAAALALGSIAAAAAPPTIQDDYPGALAEARRLGVPLVVDVWAPW
ncbi:MAG TPA: hypothetical protein VF841_14000 [Anaeromyxobacter sp.]